MVNVRIRDHVGMAATPQDGAVIYELVADALRRGEQVDVSFAGFAAVPSAFINASLVRLIASWPFQEIRERVRFSDSTKAINDLIRARLTSAAGQPPSA
jgi:hypothetical protein